MKLDNIKYTENGIPYIEYIYKSGRLKGYKHKHYGKILICEYCGENHFVTNSAIKRGVGKFCNESCSKMGENNPRWAGGVTKRETQQKYYKKNRAKMIERTKKYYYSHLEQYYDCFRKWKKNNPERTKELVRKAGRKYRALKLKVNENFTKEDENIVLNVFNNKCFRCESKENLCIDHHYPLSKGYALGLGNAVVLCQHCNSSKQDKLPDDFYNYEELIDLNMLLNKTFYPRRDW